MLYPELGLAQVLRYQSLVFSSPALAARGESANTTCQNTFDRALSKRK
jgi:hypothetical protein